MNGITRRDFLRKTAVAGLGLGVSGLLARAAEIAPARKPNILYIFPDEWRWDGIGALGLSAVRTPNLDKIAAHGVLYSNCYTCGPLCMPARVSMMTGQWVHEHGQWNNLTRRPPTSPSHVRRMRDEAGYLTGVIGKTHLHNQPALTTGKETLKQWGFAYSDEVHDLSAVNDLTTWSTFLGPEKFNRYKAYIKDYREHYEKKNPWDTKPLDAVPCRFTSDECIDSYVGNRAAEWIRDYQDKRPFYLQVNFPGPHYPMSATSEWRAKFAQAEMDLGIKVKPTAPIPPMAKWSAATYCNIQNMTDDQMRQVRLIYYAHQLMIDESIGKIMQALADKGLDDNTWVVMSSDHGEMLGDHYLMYKQVFYESSTKVPLIIRPPAGTVAKGWRSAGLTGQLDVTSTILDIGGLAPMFARRSQSLKKHVLAGPADAAAQQGREAVFSEVGSQRPFSMIRTGDYKLVVAYETYEPVELYDLKKDPRELTNLVQHGDYAGVRQQLIQQMKTTFKA